MQSSASGDAFTNDIIEAALTELDLEETTPPDTSPRMAAAVGGLQQLSGSPRARSVAAAIPVILHHGGTAVPCRLVSSV